MQRAEFAGRHQSALQNSGRTTVMQAPTKSGAEAHGGLPARPSSSTEVGCFPAGISCRPCRCLALCFGTRRHPCPCTDSPFRHEAPNQQSDAPRFQQPKAVTPAVMPLGALSPLPPPAATMSKAPECGDAAACRHAAHLPDWQPRTREDCVICMKNAAIASPSMLGGRQADSSFERFCTPIRLSDSDRFARFLLSSVIADRIAVFCRLLCLPMLKSMKSLR